MKMPWTINISTSRPSSCLVSWKGFSLILICAATLAAATGEAPFERTFKDFTVDSSLRRPHCKTAGDIDGDSFSDVLAASSSWEESSSPDDGLFWYKTVLSGASKSPTWTKYRIDTGDYSTDMQVADVDGDGDLDVVIPKIDVGIVWYENPRPTGSPASNPWKMHIIHADKDFHHDVEVGDILHKGRLDVVTRGGETRIFLQTAPDQWARVVIPTTGRSGTTLADLNGDGCLDIVQNGYWLECPKDPVHDPWPRHEIAADWPEDVGVTVADINKDRRPDVLFSPAESRGGRLSWYEAPADPKSVKWIEHVIDPDVDYIHTFKVVDMNNDGNLDLVTSEMEQSPRRRVSVYWNFGKGLTWRQQVIASNGSHNIRVADINHDGYLDIIGANHGNYGGVTPLDVWLNLPNLESAAKGEKP